MKKKFGFGTLALVLSLIGIFLSITFKESGICYGDNIINSLGLKAWSNDTSGTHYTIFYMLILFIPSAILGFKFKDDFGAKSGKIIAVSLLAIIAISPLGLISHYQFNNNKIVDNQEINHDIVNVYKIKQYNTELGQFLKSITNKEEIDLIMLAINNKVQMLGILDVTASNYHLQIITNGKKEKLWLLWLDENMTNAMIMDSENTHTGYKVSSEDTENLKRILILEP